MLWRWIAWVLMMQVALMSARAEGPSRSLMEELRNAEQIASDGVTIRVTDEQTGAGKTALRIDFDLTRGAGYGGVAFDLPIELPENYQFTMSVRGEGPANNLEFKLVDAEGLNVWWVNRRAFDWPVESTRLVSRKRHFQFAWGPSGGKPLMKLGRIELIIAANEGGRGSVWIEDLSFTPLPPEQPYTGTPVFTASSNADRAHDLPRWAAANDDAHPWLALDFRQPRDLGGMVIERPAESAPADFDIEVSDDGKTWTSIRRVRGASALPSEIMLPDLQARWLRLAFVRSSSAPNPAISNIRFLDPQDASSANAFWRVRATRASRGLFPRNLLNEQSFWTVIGQVGDDSEALINEEGQVEVDRRGFSIEPFIFRGEKLLTWADGCFIG